MNCRGLSKKLDSVLHEPDETSMFIKACAMLMYMVKKEHYRAKNKHDMSNCYGNYMIALIGIIQVPREEIATHLSSDETLFMQNEMAGLF